MVRETQGAVMAVELRFSRARHERINLDKAMEGSAGVYTRQLRRLGIANGDTRITSPRLRPV